jgi:hypothetical protein
LLDDEIDMDEGKAEMKALDARRKELEVQLKAADEPPPLLHPSMADLYRAKVESLASALQREDTRLEASEMLRGLIDSIVLTPQDGKVAARAERKSGRDVDRRPTNEKVARNRRPSHAGTNGCGGPQPAEFGVRMGCGVARLEDSQSALARRWRHRDCTFKVCGVIRAARALVHGHLRVRA